MNYVSLTDNVVTDRVGNDPYQLFMPQYAATFITAPDEVTYGWQLTDGKWSAPVVDYSAENSATAVTLLQQTDWTQLPSVADPALSNPHLANADEFATWRSTVRDVAQNPPSDTRWNPPTQPVAVWAS